MRKLVVEQLPILRQEAAMRRATWYMDNMEWQPSMIALKEVEIKEEAISVHMHQGHI